MNRTEAIQVIRQAITTGQKNSAKIAAQCALDWLEYDLAVNPAGPDWTRDDQGKANSGSLYQAIAGHVAHVIKDSAHDLIAGRADLVAGLIVSQLAHGWGMAPPPPGFCPKCHDAPCTCPELVWWDGTPRTSST